MKERINRLAKGIFDNVSPHIFVKPEWVELSVRAGEKTRGELNITSEEGLHMKGLVYSFNERVKVLHGAFGGAQNRIAYEVDTSYLKQGDRIEGSFFLVTNGGEKEIPYCFQIEMNPFEKLMEGLTDKDKFGQMAAGDIEQTLLLFEYHDFVNAPFMQDMHARTIYDGLKGRGSRANQLEEFLVALKLKEPLVISTDTDRQIFHNPANPTEGTIEIRRCSRGYGTVEIQAEGNFIKLSQKKITDQDFIDNVYRLSYKIAGDALRYGKNFGSITVRTAHASEMVVIEVMRDKRLTDGIVSKHRINLGPYLEMRLDYELSLYDESLQLGKMARELERLRRLDGKSGRFILLLAEVLIYQGDRERAVALLSEERESVAAQLEKEPNEYCFYQYLIYLLHRRDGQREALSRLLRKSLPDPGRGDYLLLLLIRLEPAMAENPGDLLARMRLYYREGNYSPFLYLEAWKLYKRNPELLKKLDSFELQVLNFAVRRQLVPESMAMTVARLAAAVKYYNRLLFQTVVNLYQLFPCREILETICSLLIKGDIRSQREFHWFAEALEKEINLTRLYEYFLHTLPEDYGRPLPKEVLLYFSYARDMDHRSKSLLYTNILTYMEPDSAVYRQYERDMKRYAIEQLFESRIDSSLAVLYKHFIYKDLIDLPVAKVLPSILRSYRIACSDPAMKYAVVCYEELDQEDAYLLKDGVAYVPFYFAHNILMFQDAYGNRFLSVSYEKSMVMDGDNTLLEKRCFEVYPRHPMLRLRECRKILDEGIRLEAELFTLEGALSDLALRPLFRRKLVSAMIDFLLHRAEQQQDLPSIENAVLWGLIPEDLPEREHGRMIEILILQGRIGEAYDMIRKFGSKYVGSSRLMKLCTKMILQKLFVQDDLLLQLTWQTFDCGRFDNVILDYLCEHFNGTSTQMYWVLSQGIEERVETYDLEERLLAQMMFSGEWEKLDPVFDLYINRKKTRDSVVKAYFTVKTKFYFIDGSSVSPEIFNYLEQGIIEAPEVFKMPLLYLLALTKYYADRQVLIAEQKNLCRMMVDALLDKDIVFPYFKLLGRHIAIPEELLTSVMVEYHAVGKGRPEIEIRILPAEKDFYLQEMKAVYPGIFVMQKQLFEGEEMEYLIYETDGEERVCRKKGSVCAEKCNLAVHDRRFILINQMCACLEDNDEDTLRQTMGEYIISAALAEELFPLL